MSEEVKNKNTEKIDHELKQISNSAVKVLMASGLGCGAGCALMILAIMGGIALILWAMK